MFFRKEYRNLDKDITRANQLKEMECEECIIDVKLEHGEEIFSKYNYENQTTLDDEFSEYLWRNAKLSPVNKPLTIKIHTKKELNRDDVDKAIKNHYREEYMDAKAEMRKNARFSLITLLLGLLSLGVLAVLYEFVDNYFVQIVMEIIAWVFVWEAADSFFLQRMHLKHRLRRIQRLYAAKVEIIEKSKA